ncbi:MAG TPA: GNAT family N-acetyltransferase [Thermomicrobiales bacterium]|nr:GNAT family N-acetyltransferase [Thermomicrobiales bacterium]
MSDQRRHDPARDAEAGDREVTSPLIAHRSSLIAVREAGPEDYKALLPAFLGLSRFSREHHRPPPRDDFDAVLAARTAYAREVLGRGAAGATLLAMAGGGGVAGYAVVSVRPPNPLASNGAVRTGLIEEFYIADEWRGRGVGGRLTAAAFDWLRRQGAERAEVGAYAWNEAALAFYRRQGFGAETITLTRPLDPSDEA